MNIRDAVQINFDSEIMYDDDQVYDSHPCRFATVGFMLRDTYELYRMVDTMRKERGYLPMSWWGEDDPYDQDGWYDLYVGLNDHAKSKVDSAITVVVVNSASDDNECAYEIALTEEEQAEVYRALDEQCRERIGKSCEDLLAESRKVLEELG